MPSTAHDDLRRARPLVLQGYPHRVEQEPQRGPGAWPGRCAHPASRQSSNQHGEIRPAAQSQEVIPEGNATAYVNRCRPQPTPGISPESFIPAQAAPCLAQSRDGRKRCHRGLGRRYDSRLRPGLRLRPHRSLRLGPQVDHGKACSPEGPRSACAGKNRSGMHRRADTATIIQQPLLLAG